MANARQSVLGATSFHLRCDEGAVSFVLPPLPVSTGSPVCCNLLNNSHRVALTAAASSNGVLACNNICLSKPDFAERNTITVFSVTSASS